MSAVTGQDRYGSCQSGKTAFSKESKAGKGCPPEYAEHHSWKEKGMDTCCFLLRGYPVKEVILDKNVTV